MKKVILFALIAALTAGALLYFYLGKLEQKNEVKVVYENVWSRADIQATLPSRGNGNGHSVPQAPLTRSPPRTPDESGVFCHRKPDARGERNSLKLKQRDRRKQGFRTSGRKACARSPSPWDEFPRAGFLQRGDMWT